MSVIGGMEGVWSGVRWERVGLAPFVCHFGGAEGVAGSAEQKGGGNVALRRISRLPPPRAKGPPKA
jgi:hypothetical protein